MAVEAFSLGEAWCDVVRFVEEHEEERAIFRHPAVLLKRQSGRLVSAYVNRCFLEKIELAWFRLQELESMEKWPGKDEFRRHFLDNVRLFSPQIRTLFEGDGRKGTGDEEGAAARVG